MSELVTEPVYHTERIEGREVEKPLPKKLHAIIQSYLIAVLAGSLPRDRYQVLSELNLLCGDDRIVPDVTVASRSATYVEGDLAQPAIFCVEISSPGQTLSSLFDKAERLLKAGTPVCWIIWPERRQAWTYMQDDLQEASATLRAALPEGEFVEIPLSEMWAELD